MQPDKSETPLTGQAATDALYEWIVSMNHVHTPKGVVYAGAIYDWLQEVHDLRRQLAEATRREQWLVRAEFCHCKCNVDDM